MEGLSGVRSATPKGEQIPEDERSLLQNSGKNPVVVFQTGGQPGKPYVHPEALFQLPLQNGRRSPVRLGKQNIQADGGRSVLSDLPQKQGHPPPGPGPLSVSFQASFIQIHDNRYPGGLRRMKPGQQLIVDCQVQPFEMKRVPEEKKRCTQDNASSHKQKGNGVSGGSGHRYQKV